MANIFSEIGEAIYSPHKYSQLAKSTGTGFGYFFKLVTLVAVLFTVGFSAWIIPIARDFLNDVGVQAVALYPAELVVKWKNGEISTNVKEPYMVPTPDTGEGVKPKYANALVIDTHAEASLQALDQAKTYVLVTKKSIVVRDQQKGQVRIQSLDMLEGEEFELSQKVVKDFVSMAVPKVKRFAPFGLILVFFGSFFMNVSLLFFALLGALFVMIVSMMRKHNLNYSRSYNATLYLMTLPILVTTTLTLARMWVTIPRIPFLFTLLLILAAFINMKTEHVTHVSPKA